MTIKNPFSKRRTSPSLLVVGLGNPGPEYADTRHNAGFLTIDSLAAQAQASYWSLRSEANICELKLADKDVVLAKPQTFMNRSGRSIKGLLRRFDLQPAALLVIHDDLDIPAHVLRLKDGGGHGGHNGLRDINAAIGDAYRRLRIGIGRPPERMPGERFVLKRLSGEALEQLQLDARLAADAVLEIINEGFTCAQNRINRT
jgi:PTH1 family peptidyl-tRNA hydrolase